MARGLSLAVGARRSSLRALAIAGAITAVAAIAASGASAAGGKGTWGVSQGKTLQLTNLNISGCDEDHAFIVVDGVELAELGSNSGNQCNTTFLNDFTFTPTDGRHHTVTVEIFDNTASCGFFSNGSNAIATRTAFSINDGGGFCATPPVIPAPTLGSSNFNGDVSVSRSG